MTKKLPTTKVGEPDDIVKHKMFDDAMKLVGTTARDVKKDTKCYKIYHGEIDNKEFSYLTEIDGNILPAKMRWIPMVTSKVNKLVSQDAQREVKSRIYASDKRSIEERNLRRAERVFNIARKRIEAVNQAQITVQKSLMAAKNRLAQLVQRSPQTQAEAAELEQLQMQLPVLESKFDHAIKNIDIDNVLTQKDIDEADRHMTYDDSDIIEQGFQGGLNEAIVKKEIKRKKVINMRNRVITGKEFYYVNWEPGMLNPVFEVIPVRNVRFSSESSKFYVQDCAAMAFDIEMSVSEVILRYGKHLKPEELEHIVRASGAQTTQNGAVVPTPNNGAVFLDDSYSTTGGNNVKVTMGFWKANRDVSYKETPNKHTGDYFRHVVSAGYKPKKGETVISKNVQDLWEGVMLNDTYYVNIRKSPLQLRRFDDEPSYVQGPIIGETFNDPANRPYSLIWETRDIQELSSIIHYHRELMLAMAGVKGIVMDVAQKADMDDGEWLMDFKRGIAWIDSWKNGKAASFNQFQTYDNTVSPALGYLTEILKDLDEMASDITGVNRESVGRTDPNDQVGTFEMAINASNLITFIIYYEHDITLQHALTRYINCARYAWKGGKDGTYMTDSNAKKFFKIHPDVAVDRFFSLFLSDSTDDNNKLTTIRQLAAQARSNREITLSQLISIFDTNNLKEMEEKISHYSEKMAKIAQDNAMSVEQQKAEAQKLLIEMKGKIDMQLQAQKGRFEEAKLRIEQGKLEMEKLKTYIDAKLKREEMGIDAQIKATEIQAETDVEMAYLAEDSRANSVDEKIRTAQLRMDGLANQANILLNADANEKSHKESMKKLDVEKTKARSQGSGKEHIKD